MQVELSFELFVDVLAVLMSLVPAYYALRLYQRDHSQKVWLVLSVAMLLTTLRRTSTLLDYVLPSDVYNGLGSATDTSISIMTIALFGWCLWTLTRRYKMIHLPDTASSKRKKKSRRGQGATEYVVLLAIVLMVALIVVGLLGFFPSFSGDTQFSESQAYWASTRPLSITDASQTYTGVPGTGVAENLTLVVENHATSTLTITSLNVTGNPDGFFAGNATSISMSPGDKTLIGVFNASQAAGLKLEVCASAGRMVSYNVSFIYNQDPISGKTQRGYKALVVRCT